MNPIQNSMKKIQASEELKKNTLQYLNRQQNKPNRYHVHSMRRFVLAALCFFFLLGAGGYFVSIRPVSYISIDVNPSIELGINRFGKVVSAAAYNKDGEDILQQLSLKNISYIQAIDRLLKEESEQQFLTKDSLLFFTIVSDHSDSILEEIYTNSFFHRYHVLLYTSDTACMEEAHQHHMSFGKYRAYIELSQYDSNITIEDCHGMTIGEIHNRTESCRQHEGMDNNEGYQGGYQESHQGHHGSQHNFHE